MRKLVLILIFIVAASQIWLWLQKDPVGPASRKVLYNEGRSIIMQRTNDGVREIWADTINDALKALGYAHMEDRQVQMQFIRVVGQGRISELLANTPETVEFDKTFRKLRMYKDAVEALKTADKDVLETLGAYTAGITAYENEGHGRPLEFLLTGFKPDPWTMADTLVTVKLLSFASLAEIQGDMEKLVIANMRNDHAFKLLKKMFNPYLTDPDPAVLEALKSLKSPITPFFTQEIPHEAPILAASNNWGVSAAWSKNNSPLYSSDPHLEVSRLPNFWYEAILHVKERYVMGVTIAGIPVVLMGRTNEVAFGFTYGFMDCIDYFVEEINDDKYKKDNEFLPVTKEVEQILRQGEAPLNITVYRTHHGIIDVPEDQTGPLNGYYLSMGYATQGSGGLPTFKKVPQMFSITTVKEGQHAVRDIELSANWIFVDRNGDLAYQQSGKLPNRKGRSGMGPVPGWDSAYDWNGFVDGSKLASVNKAEKGYLASANDLWNPTDQSVVAVNFHMGWDRRRRIEMLLEERKDDKIDLEYFKQMQRDVYSLQAERFMKYMHKMIPDTPIGNAFKNWDRRYSADSIGATLFEDFYKEVRDEIFIPIFGNGVWANFSQTGSHSVFYHYFDTAIFSEDEDYTSLLWIGRTRDQALETALNRTLSKYTNQTVPTWGQVRTGWMYNIFFNGQLPSVLGFDAPITVTGSRATVQQGQQFPGPGGRSIFFAPSWRMVTDLNKDLMETNLPGGPSGRRFSGLYYSGISEWHSYNYKNLELSPKPVIDAKTKDEL
jgi:penicillin amidase